MEYEQPKVTYRDFVDAMVSLAQVSVSANNIAAGRHMEPADLPEWPLTPEQAARKKFCLALPPNEKVLVAQMLVEERKGTVHDVLAYLEWAVMTKSMEIAAADGPVENTIEETMHGDFISRVMGYDWQRI